MSDFVEAIKSWPEPPAEALEHTVRVADHIRTQIDKCGGAISFRRYMELALFAPGLGYYSAGARKFGEEGDFTTAPEISPVFSQCLARQCALILSGLGGGDILELGAGSGRMAADMMRQLEADGVLPRRYYILEVSADLRDRQKAALAALAPHLRQRIHWLDAYPDSGIEGVIVANEVLDALPVDVFRTGDDLPLQNVVSWRNGRFASDFRDAEETLVAAIESLQRNLGRRLPRGYQSEIRVEMSAWVRGLAESLRRGVILLVDYGLSRREFYSDDRHGGTLSCHYRHRVHYDPFVYPGLQDITAWVDFTQVAEVCHEAGLTLAGFVPQAHFLLATGLDEHMARQKQGNLQQQLELGRQARLLTLPGEMGERFRVMALHRDYPEPLAGFATKDISYSL